MKWYRFFACFTFAYKVLISLPDIWNMKRMPLLLDYSSPNFNYTAVLHTTVCILFLPNFHLSFCRTFWFSFRLETEHCILIHCISLMKEKYLILSIAKYYGSQVGYRKTPKFLSSYYGLFILVILAPSKHL